jgi:hypothetical protein
MDACVNHYGPNAIETVGVARFFSISFDRAGRSRWVGVGSDTLKVAVAIPTACGTLA